MTLHCPPYPADNESVHHALVGCSSVAQVWQLVGLVDWLQLKMPLVVWFEQILATKRKDDISKVVFLMYNILHARNMLVWEGKSANVLDLWRISDSSLTVW